MAQQSSRLHRLLTLLDTGSTQATRYTAARQIGEIAKSHPPELGSLLKKVSQYLRSKSWDTRVAAAHAIGAIAENVRHTTLKELILYVEGQVLENGQSDAAEGITSVWPDFHPDDLGVLSFSRLDINRVLEFGSLLLSSGGQEYDVMDNPKNPTERLARQKQNLCRRLGLDVCEQFMDISDMIRDEDLILQKGHPHHAYYAAGSKHSQNVRQLVANMVPSIRPKRLSTRELNLLKRKAKLNAKEQSKGWSEDDELASATYNNNMKESFAEDSLSKQVAVDTSGEENYEGNDDGGWPFGQFVEQLVHDIFDPVWEIRHGALMALREILSRHGACAGVSMPHVMLERVQSEVNVPHADSAKRAREIDLNNHLTVDEAEPDLKKRKYLHEQNMTDHIVQETDWSVCSDDIADGKDLAQPTGTVVEGMHCVTLDQDTSAVKLEPCVAMSNADYENVVLNDNIKLAMHDDGSESEQSCCKSVSPSLCSEHGGPSKINIIPITPENSKLNKLIYFARRSWVRNWEVLQDCAIRFLCVLSLDRFGDFVSDQVVAPVRETCSQALGAILRNMHPSLVRQTLNVLLHMQHRQEWEVRHGSLLGMKYLVAVRQDLLDDLLVFILPACKAGLDDADDDVRAVAAEALIPAASSLASLNGENLNSVVMLLWDILLDLDDLSPSTSSVMNLLAEIYAQPEIVPQMLASLTPTELQEFDLNQLSQHGAFGKKLKAEENPYALSILTPRLWPFMRHSIASVRHSAIRTMERLLEICYEKFSPAEVSALWSESVLGDTLRIVFQNLLLESVEEILQCSERAWRLLVQCPSLERTATAYFSSWLELATTPSGVALDTSKMLCPAVLPRKSHVKAAAKMRAVKLENDLQRNHSVNFPRECVLVDGREDFSGSFSRIVVGLENEKSVTCMRVVTATALGVFAAKLPEASLPVVVDALWNNLSSLYGFRRQVAAVVLIAWFKEIRYAETSGKIGVSELLGPIRQWLLELLVCTDPSYPTKNSGLPYAELSRTYKKMRNETASLFRLADSSGLYTNHIVNANINIESLSIDDAINFSSKLSYSFEGLDDIGSAERHVVDEIESSKQQLLSTAGYLTCLQNNLHIAVSSLLAAAVVWMWDLPERLNPIVLPLMASIKREKEEVLQEKAAEALAELVFNCVGRKPSPNDKIIKNICSVTCMDPSITPLASVVTSIEVMEDQDLLSLCASTNHKLKSQVPDSAENRSKLEGSIGRRGAEHALRYLCRKFGPSLFDRLPKLWDCLTDVIRPLKFEDQCITDDQQLMLLIDNRTEAQSLINNLHVIRTVASMVDKSLEAKVLTLLPSIIYCVRHFHVAVRLAASICITSMAKTMMGAVMKSVIEKVIPMLHDSTSVHARQGAGMLFCFLVQGLGIELVPFAPLLVVPLLRCLGDSDRTVRQTVTRGFAVLVPLLPLARGVKLPIELSGTSLSNTEDAEFLEQLLDNSQIGDYRLPIKLKVEPRRYQHEGINWLSFLRRFKLHGILCDDMGLGKTLQASAIVASDIAESHNATARGHASSLVVCPSTLVGHWAYEIEKYIDDSVVSTLQYVGSVQDRTLLRKTFGNYNVVITSYDVIRKDIEILGTISWNYCVLDEGHIIKNSKSKITTAVKQLQAQHRLILTGTPIQNNVLELWSLFDFLMPGFLGTERQFQATYGKPLLAAKDSKCSAKEAEAGVLAMEALHKQVMPFILRRTKDEVLSDLPEKIIQDRYCDLSSIQLKLYEQFSSSGAKKEVSDILRVSEGDNVAEAITPRVGTSHVFQALKYLLKLCSHPLLVLGQSPPASLMLLLADAFPGSSDVLKELHEPQHSPKLVALQEILEECGIGVTNPGSEGSVAVGQHRVLIFAQHRALLDIIERDLFQAHMKSVTYLRLDGSVEPERRFEIVKSFNSDPTIDVLLLTTHVGGLGLNLTSADTLVFMEHDWNPMKDLQAMDRAHRLGQRKVVNVHRLIMRGTLEEKVMSLQRFKVSVANSVINAENASLKTMNTDQLLDLFTPAGSVGKSLSSAVISGESYVVDVQQATGKKGLKAMLGGLEELWDQSQYAEEYNLNQFLTKLDG